MIRVRKPARCPEVLRTKGKARRRSHERAYSTDSKSYDSGAKAFSFDSAIYTHPSVKSALLNAQHEKCAFCESKITHIAYGDVEHFRPKAGWRQTDKDALHRPGYYWLAYEWSNLLVACALCNQQFKRNLFPLKTPARRAMNHLQDIASEEPLLIDPAREDPEAFISFRKEVPYAIGGNARGTATIKILGLKRRALAERRWDHIERLDALRFIAGQKGPKAIRARNLLVQLEGDDAPYTSMTRAFLRYRRD
jgi:uncharacterized protein (TIGR02646 family)